jgi:hypothetical protein
MAFPETATALLDIIDQMVPERVPEADDSMAAIQRQAGKRELVLQLRQLQAQSRTPTIAKRPRR